MLAGLECHRDVPLVTATARLVRPADTWLPAHGGQRACVCVCMCGGGWGVRLRACVRVPSTSSYRADHGQRKRNSHHFFLVLLTQTGFHPTSGLWIASPTLKLL